jgi:hypothetical protein
MRKLGDLIAVQAGTAHKIRYPVLDCQTVVARRRQDFFTEQLSIGAQKHDVREGTANVYSETEIAH